MSYLLFSKQMILGVGNIVFSGSSQPGTSKLELKPCSRPRLPYSPVLWPPSSVLKSGVSAQASQGGPVPLLAAKSRLNGRILLKVAHIFLHFSVSLD